MTNEEAIIRLKGLYGNGYFEQEQALGIAIKALEIFEQAKEAGFRGEEVEFYIGGRKFAIRELAQ